MTTHHSRVDWKHDLTFDAHQNEQTFTLASSTVGEDAEPGISPKNMLLTALAGCTGMDVASLLTKMRVPFTSLRVCVDAELTDAHPRVYRNIHVIYEVGATEDHRAQIERAVGMSVDTYCGVYAMLRKGSEITHKLVLIG